MKKCGTSAILHLLLISTMCIIGWLIIPRLIVLHVRSTMVLSPDINPDFYSGWIKPPLVVYFKVYLFNVTNPEEVQQGKLPVLNEVGPYVFVETRDKLNIVTDEEEDTITFNSFIEYQFREDLSQNRSLKDELTLLNVPFVAAALISQDLPWPLKEIGRMVLRQSEHLEPLFARKTVNEILFTVSKVPFLEKLDEELGFQLLPNNSYSLLMNENVTLKGPFTVSRGIRDSSTFGKVLRYKNQTKIDFWKEGSSCNAIRGTDGSIFPPYINISEPLRFFSPDVCRSAEILYEGDSEVEGIKAVRFKLSPRLFSDPTRCKENGCFCTHIEDAPEKCLKRGAFDISPCRDGVPVAMSLPHFLYGDPTYQGLDGLNPDPKIHEPAVELEPLTGIQLKGSTKLQVNLNVKPVRGIRSLSKIPEILFPLFWVDEHFILDPISMNKLRAALFLLWLAEFTGRWILPAFCLPSDFYSNHESDWSLMVVGKILNKSPWNKEIWTGSLFTLRMKLIKKRLSHLQFNRSVAERRS